MFFSPVFPDYFADYSVVIQCSLIWQRELLTWSRGRQRGVWQPGWELLLFQLLTSMFLVSGDERTTLTVNQLRATTWNNPCLSAESRSSLVKFLYIDKVWPQNIRDADSHLILLVTPPLCLAKYCHLSRLRSHMNSVTTSHYPWPCAV